MDRSFNEFRYLESYLAEKIDVETFRFKFLRLYMEAKKTSIILSEDSK